MLNTVVIYATKTSHSKKIADAVGSALGVRAQDIKEKPTLDGAELLFIVSGIYGGVSMPELLEFAKGLDGKSIKQAAIITSCGSGRHSQSELRSILEEKGIIVEEEFICKGAILFVSLRHPNGKDIKDAADFSLKIANGVK